MSDLPLLMTSRQVADRLGLSMYRIRADVEAGILPSRRPGRSIRFTQQDVDEYVRRLAVDSAEQSGLTKGSRRRRRTA